MNGYTVPMQRGLTFWQILGRTLAVLCLLLFVAAVLFPLFAKPRGHGGRQTSCLSQEKQLGLGLLQYADNNDELMPPITHDLKNTWRVAVYPQVRANSIYKCPEDERDTPGPDSYAQSYALNAGSVLNTWRAKPQTLASAPHPETLVLLCEVQNTDDAVFDADDTVRFSPDQHILAVRHSGGGNYLLADGHSKWFRPSAFTANTTPPGTMGTTVPHWHRDPRRALSTNAVAVLADAQARAQ